MSVTPAAGTYLVWFTGSVDHSANGGSIEMSIYAGGAQNAASWFDYRIESGNATHIDTTSRAPCTMHLGLPVVPDENRM